MAEKKVIELEVKSESLGSLKSQLREAQNQVTALSEKFGATSQEAINAAKRAAELKDAISDAKALTDAFNPDAKFNALSSSIGGVLNGFQAFEGALGLIGVESKDVQQALLQVQSAMALSQGLQGLMEAKDSFKQLGAVIGQTAIGQKLLNAAQIAGAAAMRVLNVVMAANPILLVVAAIGALSGALYLFSRDTETAAEANDKLNASLTRMNESVEASNEKLTKAGENRLKILESQGASEETLHKQRLQNLSNEEKARKYSLKAEEETLKHKRAIYKQALEEEDYELAKTIQGEIKASEKRYKKLNSQHTDYVTNKTVENNKFSQYEKDQLDKAAEKEKEAADKRRQANKEANDKRIQDEKEALSKIKDAEKEYQLYQMTEQEREVSEANAKYNELVKLAIKYNQDTTQLEEARKNVLNDITAKYAQQEIDLSDKIEQDKKEKEKAERDRLLALRLEQISIEEAFYDEYNSSLLTQQQSEVQAVTDKYFRLIEEAKKYGLSTIELEEKMNKEVNAINKKYSDISKQQKLQAAQDTLNTISNLTELFAGKSEKQQKKAFQIQKAINIASAVIDTYKAANAALASSPPPFNFIAMAATITAGLVNVKKIASQEFQGGASGGGATSASAPSTGAGSSPSVMAPNFNIVGNNQATNPLSMLGSQPIQAYVVSGEVTTAQSLDRNRMNTATFG